MDHIQILKTKLTDGRTKNTKQRTMQRLITIVFWQRLDFVFSSFFFFSLISLNFLHSSMLEPLLSLPFTPIYRKRALRTMVARPCELRLSPEVTTSPSRVGSFNLKFFLWPRRARDQPGRARVHETQGKDPFAHLFWYLSHS